MAVVFAILAVWIAALFVNARWVDSQTRPAMARDGGQLIDAGGITANVRVEGTGQTIILVHGFGAAIFDTPGMSSTIPACPDCALATHRNDKMMSNRPAIAAFTDYSELFAV